MATVIRFLLHGMRPERRADVTAVRRTAARTRRARGGDTWPTRSAWERTAHEPGYYSWMRPFGGTGL